MGALTATAVLALVMQCLPGATPEQADLLTKLALAESSGDPGAIHRNANGSEDRGLMQINSANWPMLKLTASTALDPCRSINAANDYLTLISQYHTGPNTSRVDYRYVSAVLRQATVAPKPAATADPPLSATIFARPAASRELISTRR